MSLQPFHMFLFKLEVIQANTLVRQASLPDLHSILLLQGLQ
ncbi:Uncharacterised protein [Vibrio cholerae]|uniref:Uncharacterized protein n=1 Tax=Vibrio cholerae TaxID=666 RepID=A0A655P2A8_VIBCL|nr:Uncharacterised protein [Vibrio cholerae]CSB50454.1 Uncharacterised protein [Vibrio cholerae]CSB94508.1 Uncharacterised protein [Vibrio cholerae]CSC45547.1 Uncharacterised protein [Vibrio cholerae]CSI93441.1 Uncharacterised protein [Vibrio cholerae]